MEGAPLLPYSPDMSPRLKGPHNKNALVALRMSLLKWPELSETTKQMCWLQYKTQPKSLEAEIRKMEVMLKRGKCIFLNTWFWNRTAVCKTFEVLAVCRSCCILCAVLWPFIFHVLNLEKILIWYWDNAVCRHQLLPFIKMNKSQAIRFGTP
jgi:hypothetical protein